MTTIAQWAFWLIALGLFLSGAAILLVPWFFLGLVGMSIYFCFEGAVDSRQRKIEIRRYKESLHFCAECGVRLSYPLTRLCSTHLDDAIRYREVKRLAIEQHKQEQLNAEVNAEVARLRRTS